MLLTLITGVAYPLVVTGVAQARVSRPGRRQPRSCKDGKPVGSALIGQPFSDPKYFWSRPSATVADAVQRRRARAARTRGRSNPALVDAVKARIEALRAADPGNAAPVPVDLVTASASGLDPHISPAAAEYQAARVARVRGARRRRVQALVARHTEGRLLGFLGEPRVNVLELNLALDDAAALNVGVSDALASSACRSMAPLRC